MKGPYAIVPTPGFPTREARGAWTYSQIKKKKKGIGGGNKKKEGELEKKVKEKELKIDIYSTLPKVASWLI